MICKNFYGKRYNYKNLNNPFGVVFLSEIGYRCRKRQWMNWGGCLRMKQRRQKNIPLL
jgi:hypothetical protein